MILVLVTLAGLAFLFGASMLPEGELQGVRIRSGASRRAEQAARAALLPVRTTMTRGGPSRALLDAGGEPVLLEIFRATPRAPMVLLVRTPRDGDRPTFDRWARRVRDRGFSAAVLHDVRKSPGADTAAVRVAVEWIRELTAESDPTALGLFALAGGAPSAIATAGIESVQALAVRDALVPDSLSGSMIRNLPHTLLVFDPSNRAVVATRDSLEAWMQARGIPHESGPLEGGGSDATSVQAANTEAFVLMSRFLFEVLDGERTP